MMKNIALALVAFTIAAGCAYAKFSAVKPLPQPRAYVTMANEPEGTSTSTLASGGGSTITSGTWTVTAALPSGTNAISSSGMILTSNATYTVASENLIYINAAPPPQLAISCDDDTCTVNARDMDQAKALLERIAARSVTMNIDVAHDANCHPVHEHDVIARQDTKPDIVASR